MQQTIAAWLQSLGLGQYADTFLEHAIDLNVLADISDRDLEKMGVLLGHRRRILRAVAQDPDITARAKPIRAEAPRISEAERRHLTVLFCDLLGSTALSARHDPEDMHEIIRAFQDACAGIVARYDGFVAKFMGDGVLVYFGYPRAHEGDAERAVRAGLDMSVAIARLSAPDGTPLRARIGIATGLVVVGEVVGQGSSQEQAVVGDAPNLAARLQQLAEPGAVVIAESTRKLLGRRFELRDIGVQAVKGLADPVAASVVVSVARFETRFESERAIGLSVFVGREPEAAILSERWDLARKGEGQAVLVSGEAGIGKSRFIAQFAHHLPRASHRVLRYQCSPFHTTSALHPFIEQIRRTADIEENGAVPLQLDRLEATVAGSISQAAKGAIVPLFADLLSIPVDGRYAPLNQSAAQRRRETLAALVDQLEGLAARQPVVVFFEDVHWADATTLEVLNLAVARIQDLPVLMLMTCRPEFDSPWDGLANVITLTLGRLDPTNVQALIASLAGDTPLPRPVVEQIAVKTDGVPLFVEELTKMVLESGLVGGEAERLRLQRSPPEMGIPATLQDSLMARLDRMAPVRDVAQVAAAIGREFSFQLLYAVAGRDTPTLDLALARLEEAGLLFRISPSPNARYRFKHSLVQNAAYESLLKSRRQVLHARIAAVLSNQFPTVAETEPEVIAHHLSRAGQGATAAEWWSKAGQRAVERSAHIEAIAHFANAIAVADSSDEDLLPAPARLQLQIAYAQALIAAHSHGAPVTIAAFARARELVAQIAEPAERFAVYYGLWAGSNIRGELVPAREIAAAFLADVENQPPMPETGLAYRALGTTFWTMGALPQAREHLEKALEIHDPERDRALRLRNGLDPGVGTMMQLAIVRWQLGDAVQAVALGENGLGAAIDTAHTLTIAYGYGWRSLLATLRNDVARALVNAKALDDLSQEHALPVWQALGTMFLGRALAQTSGDTSGLGAMRAVIDSFREQGFLLYLTFFPALLAHVEQIAGNNEAAVALIEQAIADGENSGQRWYMAELHRQRAGLALRRQSEGLAAAEDHLQLALTTARAQNARSFERRAALMLAGVYERTDRPTLAHDLAEQWLAACDEDTIRLERELVHQLFDAPI
jgi:class 3 adenylate cyclase/tetratricopeptide (TPR) repeat protein